MEKCTWMKQKVEKHYGRTRWVQKAGAQWRSEAVFTRQWIYAMVRLEEHRRSDHSRL